MPTTPFRAYPYPAPTDPNDVAGDLQAIAEAIDADVCELTNGIVGRPVARVRGTGTFMSQSASGIGGATINRVPFDTVDFDPFGLLEFQDMTINNRLIRVTQPGYYFALATVQVPTFTAAGVVVNYNRFQIREGNSSNPLTVGVRKAGQSGNIPVNNDDSNVRLYSVAAGNHFNGTTDSFSIEFQAITTPNVAEFPINERTLTVLRMTEV